MTTKNQVIMTIRAHKEELLKYGVQRVGLFGSYAKGNHSATSDIDILIDFEDDKENYDNLMAAYDLFENMFENQQVDIVTKNGLSPYIGPKILQEVLYV